MRAAFLICFPAILQATEVELDLTIQANSVTNMTYEIGTNLANPLAPSDRYSTQLSYSGNILATAEIDSVTGQIETVRFTGGTIQTEDSLDTLSLTVGSTPFQVTFRTLGITRTTESTEIDTFNNNGFLSGGLHFTPFTAGTIEVSNFPALTGSPSVIEEVDLSTQTSDLISPDSLFPDFTDLSSIGTTQIGSNLLSKTFRAELFSLVQVPALAPDATIQAAGLAINQPFRQRYFESGSLSAIGTFTLPTAFGQWALDQNLSLTNGSEENAAGIPYSLLFALGLDPQASSLPLTIEAGSPITAHLELPAEGLGFELGVEYSPDLETDFEELDSVFLLDGSNSLKANQTGTARIAFPTNAQGYFRFTVLP